MHTYRDGRINVQFRWQHHHCLEPHPQAHAELLQALHSNAQAQRVQLQSEAAPPQLPAQQALQATLASLGATASSDHGDIATTGRPDLVLSAAVSSPTE